MNDRLNTMRRVLRHGGAQALKRRVLSAWSTGDVSAQAARDTLKRHGCDVTATEYRLMRAADNGKVVGW